MALSPLAEENTFLEQFDPYIRDCARYRFPYNAIPSSHMEDEIDEICQKTRIKLWVARKRGPISNPTAYINAIVFTEIIDVVRRYRKIHPLPVDDDGEFSQSTPLVISGQEAQNPIEILEQEERATEAALWAFHAILGLPPRQQYALLWGLKKQIDDVLPVIAILSAYNIDIEKINIVQKTPEKQRLNTLLSLARKKLRQQYQSRRLVKSLEGIGMEA